MFSLKGKVAVITGGSSGIGRATAERFVKAGATVVIAARNDAEEVATEIGATFIRADVAQEDDVRALMDTVAERHGRIDICVNNAGVFTGSEPMDDTSASTMTLSFQVNTLGAFYGMNHAAPHMPPGSSIINTSSIGADVAASGYAAYTAAKAALNGLSKVAALELGPKGIRVNCVCPASVNTPMLTQAENGEAEALICQTTSALGVNVEPEEVAALMHFLAADDCRALTGQAIVLDGGITAGFSEAAALSILKAAGIES